MIYFYIRLAALAFMPLMLTVESSNQLALRGGSQSDAKLLAPTALVSEDEDDSQLEDQELEDEVDPSIDEDPESVYEATVRDQEISSELQNREAHFEKDIESVVNSTDPVDIEAAFESARSVALKGTNSIQAVAADRKPNNARTSTTSKLRSSHLRQLMHSIAKNVSRRLVSQSPRANVQVRNRRTTKSKASTISGKTSPVKGLVSDKAQSAPKRDAKPHPMSTSSTESSALEATTKIAEIADEAASSISNDLEDDQKIVDAMGSMPVPQTGATDASGSNQDMDASDIDFGFGLSNAASKGSEGGEQDAAEVADVDMEAASDTQSSDSDEGGAS